MDTSLIIYDNGEGQHPEDFEKTFLSLLRGKKNEMHFVHGKGVIIERDFLFFTNKTI